MGADQSRSAQSSTPLVWFALLSIASLFIIFRYLALQSVDLVNIWFDSGVYSTIAHQFIWTSEFWFGFQPPLYPYLMKYFAYGPETLGAPQSCSVEFGGLQFVAKKPLAEQSPLLFEYVRDGFCLGGIVVFQWLFSVASWIVFAVVMFYQVSHRLWRWLLFVLILLIGCETSVLVWERNILTESISISLLLLIFSGLSLLFRSQRQGMLVLTLLLLVLFSLLRVTHNYLFLMMMLWIAGHFATRRWRWSVSVMILALSVFAFNQFAMHLGDRTETPIRSIVSSRVATSGFEDIRSYFEAHGMPSIPEKIVGQFWYAPFDQYPELEHWVHQEAGPLYQKFLITHPSYFLLQPYDTTNRWNPTLQALFTPDLGWQSLPGQLGLKLFFSDYFLWILLPVSGLFIWRIKKDRFRPADSSLLLISIGMMVTAYVLALINWHGDMVDVNRHILPSMLQIRIGLVLFLFSLLGSEVFSNQTREGMR